MYNTNIILSFFLHFFLFRNFSWLWKITLFCILNSACVLFLLLAECGAFSQFNFPKKFAILPVTHSYVSYWIAYKTKQFIQWILYNNKNGLKSGNNENREEGDKMRKGRWEENRFSRMIFLRLETMWDRNEWEKKMKRTKKKK